MTLRLAFMGTPDFAVPLLAELIAEGHAIAAVYSQPARPKGRGMKEEPSPVAKLALHHGLEVRTPVSLRNPEAQAAFAALNLDVAVVAAYGLILPKPVLEAPKLGCWNLHGSLLPRWRGAAPIQRAVMAGDSETGVMVMRMEEGLDTGPVLLTEKVIIGRRTAGELTNELARLGAKLMAKGLHVLEDGSAAAVPQAEDGVTYAKKIEKSEARIWWNEPAATLDCIIRGLSPWPGAWTECEGKSGNPERIKILLAEPRSGTGAPGNVLKAGEELIVACGEGALRILKLQRAGSKVQDAATFLRGFPLKRGQNIWDI